MATTTNLSESKQGQVHLTGGAAADAVRYRAMSEARFLLRNLSPEERKTTLVTQATAAIFLDVDDKTLNAARTARINALSSTPPTVIHPLKLASIHFVDIQPRPKYSAQELLNYIDRLEHAGQLHPTSQKHAIKYPEKIRPRILIGFQTWMATATAEEEWPFCIQADGHPMEWLTAIASDKTTDDVRWLTIRGFAELATSTAQARSAKAEGVVIAVGTPTPESTEKIGHQSSL